MANSIDPTHSLIDLIKLVLGLSAKKDRIKVVAGHYQPFETQTEGLYVYNLSDHEVHIRDYGFILGNGKFFSIPACYAFSFTPNNEQVEFYKEPYFEGSLVLKHREMMKCGKMMHNMHVIGAYAVTAVQDKPTKDFYSPWFKPKHLMARLKVKMFPSFDHRYD